MTRALAPAPSFLQGFTAPMGWNLSTLQGLQHGAAQAGRAVGNVDTGHLQSLDLEIGGIVAAGDDGARVTHPATRRSRAARDETDDRLGGLAGLDELGPLDLGVAA